MSTPLAIPSIHKHARRRPVWMSTALPIVLSLVLRIGLGPAASISYLVLAIFALFGRIQAILALALSWLFTMINPGIVGESGGGSAGRYLVIGAASVTAVFSSGLASRGSEGSRAFVAATALLGAFLVTHSVLFSVMPDVSVLKALSWALTMTALISLWQSLSPQEFKATASKLYWGLVLVLVTSLPLLFHPAGFRINGTGFQGVLNHPQAFGTSMALLGAWSGAHMFAQRLPDWRLMALTGASVVLIFLSEARTGGVAMILGLGLSLILSPVFVRKSLIQIAPGFRSGRLWAAVFGTVLAGVSMASAFSHIIANFLSKSGRASSSNLFEAYEGSRGFLMDAMLVNIVNDPWQGIGLGIASVPSSMIVERDSVLGLPLSAAVEKGVAPLAVLEEVGIIGLFFVALWLLALLRKGAVGGLAAFAVCLTALLLNLGENTLFSPGGHGLLVMVLFGWAYASGTQRNGHV